MARPFAATLGHLHPVPRADRDRSRPRVQAAPFVAGLRFAFPHPTLADVYVVDASGRRVRTLASGEIDAGEHECGWDGFDDAGARCAPGDYRLRLETSGSLLTSRIVPLG
jgi:FlgD Ig-like domain